MNVFCPNCGSQNDAAGKFCWKCGNSLAGVRPAATGAQTGSTPQAATTPPPRPPVPAATQPPVAPSHPAVAAAPPFAAPPPLKTRLPMPVLIGAFVAILGIGAAVGIVLGVSGNGPSPSPLDLPTAAPSLAVPTPGPIASIGPGPTSQGGPTPSPLVATPHPDPTPAPTTAAGGSQDVSTDSISITVPADWDPKVYDNALSVRPTVGGILYLQSEILPNPATSAAILQADIASMKEHYPDLKICDDEKDVTLPNGPTGRSVTLCFTAGTQSGKAYAATNYLAAATLTRGQDTILFYLSIYAADTEWKPAVEAVIPVLSSINWYLY